MTAFTFDKDLLTKDLKTEARALGIPVGAANSFVEKTVTATCTKLKKKKIITKRDLERTVVAELKKYNADLAYVYQNRDKII